ncbi:MAG: Dabb family protein [Chloroflexaceae bacterium]|nr:Dabb family protein [Chloroflexaceae bacterium]
MICHVVLFGIRADVPQTAIDERIAALQGLTAIIPEIRSMTVARDEIGSERSATFGLISTFDTLEALRTYQQHPQHQAVAAQTFALSEWVKAWDFTTDA